MRRHCLCDANYKYKIALEKYMFTSSASRKPALNDLVILSNRIPFEALKGLRRGEIATVISYDKSDPGLCYQIRLPNDDSTPWFSNDELELWDVNCAIPKPTEPDTNACCGSRCENCVWINYFEDLRRWEANQ